jgi:undecaprenyl diphosphate synthase
LHVLIIPDGNRRYAKQKNLDISVVYTYISDDITTKIIKYLLIDKNVDEFTIFGISRDNVLKRNSQDLNPIYGAQISAYKQWEKSSSLLKNISFRFIGDLKLLPKEYVSIAQKLEKKTKNNKKIVNILVAYDSCWEIQEASKETKFTKELSEEEFLTYLKLPSYIDILVRTGGEKRLSGAPIYQSKYAELFFLNEFYPDFNTETLNQILNQFNERQRRFGK